MEDVRDKKLLVFNCHEPWVYQLGTLGFEPKLKPEAYAASCVADRDAVRMARRKNDSPAQKRRYRQRAH